MKGGEIRIGKVSRVDYKTGMVSVVFTDLDDDVTELLPYITFNNEYHPPDVESYVAVMHLSNGPEVAFVLGRFWDGSVDPEKTGKDVYRKELSNTPGKAWIQWDPDKKEITINAENITVKAKKDLTVDSDKNVTVKSDATITVNAESSITIQSSGPVTVKAAGACTLSDSGGTTTVGAIIAHMKTHG